jgi:hypothetical protein
MNFSITLYKQQMNVKTIAAETVDAHTSAKQAEKV